MPIYEYEIIREDGQGGDVFEVLQSLHDPPLTRHPQTGQPVRRLISRPNLGGPAGSARIKSTLSDRNLAAKGFTKYVRTEHGRYEKTAGSGPDRLGPA